MKRAFMPVLAVAITMSGCSSSDDRLSSECAMIDKTVNVPVDADFDEAKFAAQLRTLRAKLKDRNLADQVGIIAENWEAHAKVKPGTTYNPENPEQQARDKLRDRSIGAENQLYATCNKTGNWHDNRPKS
ncbi:hypothetical protein [Actinomadura litoris]|uniref:Lipoprotein n=1 Tax=Actinomadura litoris TaxID=2678616 RepID=A0A7K1L7P5_9ACTN|nr:hypothetical protein [Actinomadura litoris]MUN40216.1 hypothetical protein [Actinomadura litoris]